MAKKVTSGKLPTEIGKVDLTVAERFQILNNRVKAYGYSGLGEYVGVHRVTVSGWMTGKKLPDPGSVEKILQVSGELLTGEMLVEATKSGKVPANEGRGKPKNSIPKLTPQIPKSRTKADKPIIAYAAPSEDDDWDF